MEDQLPLVGVGLQQSKQQQQSLRIGHDSIDYDNSASKAATQTVETVTTIQHGAVNMGSHTPTTTADVISTSSPPSLSLSSYATTTAKSALQLIDRGTSTPALNYRPLLRTVVSITVVPVPINGGASVAKEASITPSTILRPLSSSAEPSTSALKEALLSPNNPEVSQSTAATRQTAADPVLPLQPIIPVRGRLRIGRPPG